MIGRLLRAVDRWRGRRVSEPDPLCGNGAFLVEALRWLGRSS